MLLWFSVQVQDYTTLVVPALWFWGQDTACLNTWNSDASFTCNSLVDKSTCEIPLQESTAVVTHNH